MDSSDLSDGPITLQEYLEVKKALASSEAKVQQLMKVNNNLSEELRRLQKEVGKTDDRRGRDKWGQQPFFNRFNDGGEWEDKRVRWGEKGLWELSMKRENRKTNVEKHVYASETEELWAM